MTPYVYRKISVNVLIKEAREKLLETIVKSQLSVEGVNVNITTSTTNWGGRRIWFVCPSCRRKCEKLLETDIGLLCIKCLLPRSNHTDPRLY